MTHNYLNLTDGLGWADDVPDHSYCRIESTAIGRRDWCRVLRDLDADLLFHLALGRECVVYDCGTRRPVSEAVGLGVPYLRGFLARVWIDRLAWRAETQAWREAERKVMYFARYLDTDVIRLSGKSRLTERDGDRAYRRAPALGAT